LHCIDAHPYRNYNDYPKYTGKQDFIYLEFIENLEKSSTKDKIITHRGHTNMEIPKFEDDYFDIIYISSYYGNDGKYATENVLEDAVLSFHVLKINGYMIFNNYSWEVPNSYQRGIDGFLHGYHNRIEILGHSNEQLFVQRCK